MAKNHARILEAARAALRFDAAGFVGEVRAHGAGTVSGLPARWERRCHADGRIVERVDAALGRACGFDGHAGWRVDETGMPGDLDLGDLEELVVATAVWDGRWLLGEGAPVEVGPCAHGHRDTCAVALRVRGGTRTFHLALDPEGGLPRRIEDLARDDQALFFADHGPGGFCYVAHRIVSRMGWLEDTLRVEAVERKAEVHDGSLHYARVEEVPGDTAFDAGVPVPASRSPRGKLPLVRPRVDGRDVGWFLLDTGAGALGIDAAVAASLGLRAVGRRFVRTADGGVGAVHRRAAVLAVGPLTVREPLFVEVDMGPFGRACGVKLAGVLGYDLFARAVVTLDPAPREPAPRVAIDDPASYALEDPVWAPLRFEQGRPMVAARVAADGGAAVDGVTGVFAIDTGSSVAVTLYAAAPPTLALRRGARAAVRGLTGARSGRAAELAWIEVAGCRFEEVPALVAAPGPGVAGATAGVLGSLGATLFRDAALILDVPRRRLALRGTRPGAPRLRLR
jgi:predicted aspartyl protease